MVADVFALDHEDDVFGHVGGVVADPFHVAGEQNQVHVLGRPFGIFFEPFNE
jgi:hypothetical protein